MMTMRLLTLLTTTVLTLLVTALPLLAAETPSGKSEIITRSPHHVVGSIILAISAVFVVAAVGNALRQLRGERGQASGRFRWR